MAESIPFSILYRDEHCIAIAKSPGIHVHHSALSPHEPSCMPFLRDMVGTYVYPIHRIDRATSGIVLFAVNQDAHVALNTCMRDGGMKKRYHAIVRGWMESCICDSPIRIDDKVREAETHFFINAQRELEYPSTHFDTTRISLMEIGLKTGRRHQIRKHCAHLRHPIVGDVRYGDGKLNLLFREHFGLHRLLLFATSLQFTHPITQQELHIQFDPSKEDAIVRTFFERYQLIISQ